MPGDQDELVKGQMALGVWDGSQDCTRGAGGTRGRVKGLPRNLGSAPTPAPKPPGCLCQHQSVGDTGGARPWAGGCAGTGWSLFLGWHAGITPCPLPDTGFRKGSRTETHQVLLDRPLHPLCWEGLDLAERLPPGPGLVSALGRDGCRGGHLHRHPRDPSAVTRAPPCTRRFQLSPWDEGRACGVLRGCKLGCGWERRSGTGQDPGPQWGDAGARADVVVQQPSPATLAGLCCVVFPSKFANGEGWKEHLSVPDKPACAHTPILVHAVPVPFCLAALAPGPASPFHGSRVHQGPHPSPWGDAFGISAHASVPLNLLPGLSPSSGCAFTPGTAQLTQEVAHARKGLAGGGGDRCSWHSARSSIAKAERKRSGES